MQEFAAWYEREHSRVLASCYALAGDADVAREATDEAFVRALERWKHVQAMEAPGGWVQVVALNQLRRRLRRRDLEARFLRLHRADELFSGPPPDAELWMLVGRLPARQQTAVVLRYVHDLPEATVAELMGVARGTVASTLSAAHASLRRAAGEPTTSEETIRG
jgi:RNA polymerase sigma-70 factor, ECF subfamily